MAAIPARLHPSTLTLDPAQEIPSTFFEAVRAHIARKPHATPAILTGLFEARPLVVFRGGGVHFVAEVGNGRVAGSSHAVWAGGLGGVVAVADGDVEGGELRIGVGVADGLGGGPGAEVGPWGYGAVGGDGVCGRLVGARGRRGGDAEGV